jgi:hypothetical protein
MYNQLFRVSFIIIFALLTHALFNISPSFGLSKQIQYPLIIGLTPYLISKLPLLGTKDLMIQGVQPLVSMTFLILCTIIIQYVVKEISQNSQMDFLSVYIKDEKPLRIEGFEIKKDFIVVLFVVIISEFIFQGIVSANEYSRLEKALLRALAKFHKRN